MYAKRESYGKCLNSVMFSACANKSYLHCVVGDECEMASSTEARYDDSSSENISASADSSQLASWHDGIVPRTQPYSKLH